MTDELIARLEAATGADRELDKDIQLAVFDPYAAAKAREHPEDTPEQRQCYLDTLIKLGPLDYPKPYTASIDAALTLVPEGWDYVIYSRGEASVHRTKSGRRTFYEAIAATPALAICIAALKARGEEN